MDDINFCPSCGKNLSSGTVYCPACGRNLNAPEEKAADKAVTDEKIKGRATIAAALILLHSIPLLLLGAFMYLNAASVAEEAWKMYEGMPFFEVITDHYTLASLTDLIRICGAAAVIGGAMGVASGVLALMRRLWIPTIILCLISACIAILSLIGLVMGLIAFILLIKARPVFVN